MKDGHITFALETSCDDTSVGVVRDGRYVLAHVVSSQVKQHSRFGGVVPEMASRLHVKHITTVMQLALEEAGLAWSDVDLVAATQGPGLLGALAVGFMAGKTLAYSLAKPFIGVHHIEGHIYANLLDDSEQFEFPVLALVASGVLDPSRLIKFELNLEEGAKALQYFDSYSRGGITIIKPGK